MTFDELYERLNSEQCFPSGFSIETDNDGQIVIYTGLTLRDGQLVEFVLEEERKAEHIDREAELQRGVRSREQGWG